MQLADALRGARGCGGARWPGNCPDTDCERGRSAGQVGYGAQNEDGKEPMGDRRGDGENVGWYCDLVGGGSTSLRRSHMEGRRPTVWMSRAPPGPKLSLILGSFVGPSLGSLSACRMARPDGGRASMAQRDGDVEWNVDQGVEGQPEVYTNGLPYDVKERQKVARRRDGGCLPVQGPRESASLYIHTETQEP